MIAAINNHDTKERRKLKGIITVPNMTEPIGKSIRSVLKNPVDIQLEMYSSANPELMNPLDLKMMSKLDRLRKHNELRQQTKQIKNGLDKTLEDITTIKTNLRKKEEEVKRQEEIQLTTKKITDAK